jgi:FixJ family two-component response regulator
MRTIAVVEDDPSMLQGLSRLLSAHGFRVVRLRLRNRFLTALPNARQRVWSWIFISAESLASI